MTKCIWRKTTVTTLPKPHWCLRGGPQVRTCLPSPHYLPHVNEYEKQCEKEEEFDYWLALPFLSSQRRGQEVHVGPPEERQPRHARYFTHDSTHDSISYLCALCGKGASE